MAGPLRGIRAVGHPAWDFVGVRFGGRALAHFPSHAALGDVGHLAQDWSPNGLDVARGNARGCSDRLCRD